VRRRCEAASGFAPVEVVNDAVAHELRSDPTGGELYLFVNGKRTAARSCSGTGPASGTDPIAYLTEVATRAQRSPGAVLLPAELGAVTTTAA
jgi:hypothetical protein